MTGGVQIARLADGRLHLQHGPIDLIIEAFGPAQEVAAAYDQAVAAFDGLLALLVEELALLRAPVGAEPPALRGPVARRMRAAVWPHRATFVTPMAAVAGAVADAVLEAMVAGRRLRRAYVNNGGDIALYLRPGERLRAGLVGSLDHPVLDGIADIEARMPVRGIATSGRGGRSLSLGIADAVTVLARHAAAADVAATLIANAVDVDHPAVLRRPAAEVDEMTDLGDRLVTVAVGPLEDGAVDAALAAGVAAAEDMRGRDLMHAAVLLLAGQVRVVGADPALAAARAA
ncbi:MAG: UPF0280 family protein [Alphaproteobacteria bacterium]|nr:UPF0280 family protein [Alphaproteobacteria bacterium]